MKYTDINRELPPLGIMLTVRSEDDHAHVGYFCINIDGDRRFYCFCGFPEEITKWARLPEWRKIDEKTPLGETIYMTLRAEGATDEYIKLQASYQNTLGSLEPTVSLEGIFYKPAGWLSLDDLKDDDEK